MNFKYFKQIVPMTVMALSLGLGSCVGDLDVTPIDPSTNMTPDYNALFIKCYANMAVAGNGGADGDCDIDGLDGGTTGFVRQLFNANELTTDEAMCSWGDEGIPAFNYNQWGASHPMLKGYYYRLYFGVTMCNFYLTEAAEHDATMTAEVRFLRAMYYYYLMDAFGNVPFLTSVSSDPAPQATRAEVYQFVESELLECESLLKTPKNNNYGRVDQAAAWLLLSRLYLNAEVYTGTQQWSKAAEYAKKVMDSNYSLHKSGRNQWSAYQMLFMGDNGENGAQSEAILPLIQNGPTVDNAGTTSWGTTLFLMASTFRADMTLVGESANNTTETWAGNRCRPDLLAKFFPNNTAPNADLWEMVAQANDDRALFWGKDRTLSVDDPADFANGFSCAKFTNFYSTNSSANDSKFPDTDYFLMRAAEAWLTYAEASMRANGNVITSDGIAAINEIRTRANAAVRSTYTLDDVLDEWSREFYFEGRRRSDLIRFGYYGGNSSYRWQWKGGTQNGTTFNANLNIFAIPDTDLNANPNLKQNPGY
ncbi:MAG: RagB/SusD family nutrient uptake outer membrane protein [Phocaeicola sp.]